jgi:allophanate hydrolase subunit 1
VQFNGDNVPALLQQQLLAEAARANRQTFETLIDLQDAFNAVAVKYRSTSIAVRSIKG